MTTVAATTSPLSYAGTLLARSRAFILDRQRKLFSVATGLVILHLLDDAFVNPGRGLPAGHNLRGFAIAAGLALVAAALFPRLPAALRVAISFVFGLLALFVAYMHAAHVAWDGAVGSDFSGVLLFPAAGLYLLLAAALLLRPKKPSSAVRRWGRRAAVIPAALFLVFYVVLPVAVALWQTQKPRQPVDTGALAVPREEVTLSTSDGLDLAGWYIPSKNHAAVLLVHGGGGSREGVAAHAEMFARNGYGVLLYDARGRGESEGRTDGYGWTWREDVSAALSYLENRPDVAPRSSRRSGSSRALRPDHHSPSSSPVSPRHRSSSSPPTGRSSERPTAAMRASPDRLSSIGSCLTASAIRTGFAISAARTSSV
jgi:hypothetical protein